MPNFCQNKLVIEGPLEGIQSFLNALKNSNHLERDGLPNLSFQAIVPLCQQTVDEESLRYIIERWGTKWDIGKTNQVCIDKRNDPQNPGIAYIFQTAWTPPEAFCIEASKRFSNLSFILSYYETTIGFCGCTAFEAGRFYNYFDVDLQSNPIGYQHSVHQMIEEF